MGRTLVLPPAQTLYLIGKQHKEEDGSKRSDFGLADFFNITLLRSHAGWHTLEMPEFLERATAHAAAAPAGGKATAPPPVGLSGDPKLLKGGALWK